MHCKCNAYLVYLFPVMEMAEFCLQCWNELNETNDTQDDYILSEELDLYEGCGKWTNIIVARRRFRTLGKISRLFRMKLSKQTK